METAIDDLVRSRLRAIRRHLGWSLDELATRSGVGASTISRIETGHRSISFDVLIPLARELHVSVDELVATDEPADVVIRPEPQHSPGVTRWQLSRPGSPMVAVKMRFEPGAHRPEPQVHPGHDFMFVLDGTVRLTLGERELVVNAGESAEFSTMTPHCVAAIDRPADVLMVLDRAGAESHLDD
ncbi:helix-turn-helix domain-containing protein [Ilumatobacter nonamiensis]|uniref:helix-turn-helix domain-containing protein n=1 Tax=Ilumatobacter nonamiensis TaxID=467093 RepID=UPI00034BC755|nr:XRE family transcriptional regulator [Ilumatobacter nonamiensis]